jgi:hypothetical protein
VTQRVPGGLDDLNLEAAELDRVAFRHFHVDAGNALGLALGADDGATCRFLELQVTAGVIAVMVGDQQVRQLPALRLQPREDGLGVGRVDRRRDARLGVVDQHTVVVGKASKLLDFELRHQNRLTFLASVDEARA